MNDIDNGFKNYISKVEPPDMDIEWMEYIEMMWANAFSMGVNATIKHIENSLKG